MARRINTKKYETKINELYKARSAEFNNEDDTEYNRINRRLNYNRDLLQRIYNWNAKVRHMDILPERDGQFTYTRYETLSENIIDRIDRWFHPVTLNWVYTVDGFLAKNLKDAVAYCNA